MRGRRSEDYTVPESLFREKVRVGFGLWLDLARRWDPVRTSKNHFTPKEFQKAIKLALEIGDGYVWIWSEIANWYADSPDWKPADNVPMQTRARHVPDAYRQAIRKGRAAANK